MKKCLFSLLLMLILLVGCSFGASGYQVTLKYNNGTNDEVITTSGEISLNEPTYEGYVFMGWYNGSLLFQDDQVSSNMTLNAKWVAEGTKYSIFYDTKGGSFEDSAPSQYPAGEEFTLPEPTRKYYQFDGWYMDEEYQNGSYTKLPKYSMGTITLYAAWIDVANYKQINYVLDGATLPEDAPTKYIVGEATQLPSASKEHYIFRGWYNNPECSGNRIKVINKGQTEDVTLYPLFVEAIPENLAVSVYGDSISTFVGYSPSEYPVYYPQHDVTSVSDTWWYSAITKAGMQYCGNASYSGGVVLGTTEQSGTNATRIKKLSQNGVDPDIVLIFMGINDVTNVGENKASFKLQYLTMINNIKNQYPNVEILICTLIASTLGSESAYLLNSEYNAAIRELASENDLMLAELDLVITPDNKDTYMANAKHPNKAGMAVIAECVANVLIDKYKSE